MSLAKYFILTGLIGASLTAITYADGQTTNASSNVTMAPQTKQNLRKQNHQLEKNVRHAFSKAPNLDSANIVVLARNGAVVLDGSGVDNEQIQLAATTAASVSGVASVKNNLHVREEGH